MCIRDRPRPGPGLDPWPQVLQAELVPSRTGLDRWPPRCPEAKFRMAAVRFDSVRTQSSSRSHQFWFTRNSRSKRLQLTPVHKKSKTPNAHKTDQMTIPHVRASGSSFPSSTSCSPPSFPPPPLDVLLGRSPSHPCLGCTAPALRRTPHNPQIQGPVALKMDVFAEPPQRLIRF